MSGFRADLRAAALALMDGYKASVNLKLQTYPARPASIYPPTGFVDAISESIIYTQGPIQRTPTVDLIFIAGVFDSKDAVEQQDKLVDGFLAWTRDHLHQAGGSTLVTVSSIQDIPNYEPDWIVNPRVDNPAIYYASRLSLEGLMSSGSLV